MYVFLIRFSVTVMKSYPYQLKKWLKLEVMEMSTLAAQNFPMKFT